MNDPIVEIHLATTNSEMAAVIDGEVQVIDDAGETILPRTSVSRRTTN